MNRRAFVYAVSGVALSASVAGCNGDGGPTDGEAGGAADESGGAAEGPAGETTEGPTERVVVAVGEDDGATTPSISETDAPEIEIDETAFERLGPNEFVVDGVVGNVGDQAFAHLEIDVGLYESGGSEEGFFDEAERNRELEYLAATETYTFRLRFDDVEIEDVSHYSVTATATIATPTP